MVGSKKLNWAKVNRKERGIRSIVETIRLEENYRKIIKDHTLEMTIAALRRFNATQRRKIAARDGPAVSKLTAIYTDRGTRISLPSKAAAFVIWREKGGGT